MDKDFLQSASDELNHFLASPNAYRSLLLLAAAFLVAYILSSFLTKMIVRLAQIVGTRSEKISNRQKLIRYRQIETYLSIAIAMIRGSIVAVAGYFVWRLISPASTSGAAAIGASAFFIVIAGQTLGILLRDLMSGTTMITEGWFHVGDHIKVEPFWDVSGVVERFTLRSTKLRSLNGEVIWMHNQQIQAVHVTPNSVRTFVVDIFTREPSIAQSVIQDAIDSVPASSALVRKPLKFGKIEEWGPTLWHITVDGKTAVGREWLIENFFIGVLKEIDEGKSKEDKLFVYEPTARYADETAEKKFRRSIR